mmetsp:Transcript_17796/g.27503  ORF Transcript_17796/g.27503 Transcript_17796/m.27503 type:complete len:240 (-) Transcript_17796:72-791(-)
MSNLYVEFAECCDIFIGVPCEWFITPEPLWLECMLTFGLPCRLPLHSIKAFRKSPRTGSTSSCDANLYSQGSSRSSCWSVGASNQLLMGIALSGCSRYDMGLLSTMITFRTSRPSLFKSLTSAPWVCTQASLNSRWCTVVGALFSIKSNTGFAYLSKLAVKTTTSNISATFCMNKSSPGRLHTNTRCTVPSTSTGTTQSAPGTGLKELCTRVSSKSRINVTLCGHILRGSKNGSYPPCG